jgi:RNA polymerase sigma factor (sigma-70 family)
VANLPTTDPGLLVAVADPRDHEAWSRFLDLYFPLLYGCFLRATGNPADAADLTQQTLHKVSRAVGRFVHRPASGCSFHGWLFCVARRVLIDHRRGARRRSRTSVGEEARRHLDNAAARDDGGLRREEQEHARHVVRRALERARDDFDDLAWTAFWRTAVEGETVRAVAADLGLSVIAVYRARWAVQDALRNLLHEFDTQ